MSRSGLKKLFFCIAGVVLAIALGIFICLLPPGPGPKPGISVLGPTNDPAKGPSVLFSLTNSTASQMFYVVCPPDLKSGGIWSPLPQPQGSGLDLPAHQSTNFTVAIPSGADAWRVPVLFGYPSSGIYRFRGVVAVNVKVNWLRLKLHRRPIAINQSQFNVYASYSPEMGRESIAEPEGTPNRSQVTNN
jgi:hypothetical protein